MSIIFDEKDIKPRGEIMIGSRWWTITGIVGDSVWLQNQQNPTVTMSTPMAEIKKSIERNRASLTSYQSRYPSKRPQTKETGG